MKKQTLVALAICALASTAFAQVPQARPAGGAPQVVQMGGPTGGAPGMQQNMPFPEMKAAVLKNLTTRLAEMTTVKACFEKAADKEAFDKCRPQRPPIQMQPGMQPGGPQQGQGKVDFKQFMQQQRGQGVGAPPQGQAR